MLTRKAVTLLVPTRLRARWRLHRRWQTVRSIIRRADRSQPIEPHGLPVPLVISLTSYPKRFKELHRTIESLLEQNVTPDHIVLWIARGDAHLLPRKVRALERRGLTIRLCEDLRQYKKLLPALAAYPSNFIVTADDDLFYEPNWLRVLVRGYDRLRPTICFHRGHRITADADGCISRYQQWQWDVRDDAARMASSDLLPTGVGGVLYPPNALHPDVANYEQAARLAPTNDDLWFYWMARRAGSKHRKVGGTFRQVLWPGSQDEGLYQTNIDGGGNDKQVADLEAAYPLGSVKPPALRE